MKFGCLLGKRVPWRGQARLLFSRFVRGICANGSCRTKVWLPWYIHIYNTFYTFYTYTYYIYLLDMLYIYTCMIIYTRMYISTNTHIQTLRDCGSSFGEWFDHDKKRILAVVRNTQRRNRIGGKVFNGEVWGRGRGWCVVVWWMVVIVGDLFMIFQCQHQVQAQAQAI